MNLSGIMKLVEKLVDYTRSMTPISTKVVSPSSVNKSPLRKEVSITFPLEIGPKYN